jgi:hypothetical protein
MANYSKLNFCVPAGDSTYIRIRDIKGSIKFTVYNSHETLFFNSGNNLIIRTEGDNSDIILDFQTKVEAIQALAILNLEYGKIKKNYEDKKILTLIEDIGGTVSGDIKDLIFSSEAGSQPISNGQTIFNIPNALSINSVIINGIVINDYEFNIATKNLTLDIINIGYSIEDSDEVVVKYY